MRTRDVKPELAALCRTGLELFAQKYNESKPDTLINIGKPPEPFQSAYQKWYARSVRVLKALSPERLDEFIECYTPDPKRKTVDALNYTVRDHLWGLSVPNVDTLPSVIMKLQHQHSIIEAVYDTFEDKIHSIEQTLRADLFDSELDAAEDLLAKGHLRAAGALVGVVLETHLNVVSAGKGISIRKQNPTISDYNDKLKENEVIDIPQWRLIQRLSDIRNMSVHKKNRDPTKDEIQDLVIGTKKVITEVM